MWDAGNVLQCTYVHEYPFTFGTCHGVRPIAVQPFCTSHVTGGFRTLKSQLYMLVLALWPAIGTDSSALTVSNKRYDCCLG